MGDLVAFPANAAIHTLTGPLSIGEFASMCAADPGTSVPVFTWDGIQITVGLARDCRPVGEEQIYEVHLDDRTVLYVSSSTEFVLRHGSEGLRPPELALGESLMPLYLGEDSYHYPIYYENGTSWKRAIAPADRTYKRKISRMVAEWKEGRPLPRGTFVEHIDKNRKNYHPDNLRIVHKPAKAIRTKTYDIVKAVRTGQRVIREVEGDLPKRRGPNNHAVHDVKPSVMMLVYEFSVDPTDVVVMSGVFVRSRLC